MINQVQVRVSKASSHVFLDDNLWIYIKLHSRVMPGFAFLECHCSLSEESVAKLVHRVLLLYLVVSSALER